MILKTKAFFYTLLINFQMVQNIKIYRENKNLFLNSIIFHTFILFQITKNFNTNIMDLLTDQVLETVSYLKIKLNNEGNSTSV